MMEMGVQGSRWRCAKLLEAQAWNEKPSLPLHHYAQSKCGQPGPKARETDRPAPVGRSHRKRTQIQPGRSMAVWPLCHRSITGNTQPLCFHFAFADPFSTQQPQWPSDPGSDCDIHMLQTSVGRWGCRLVQPPVGLASVCHGLPQASVVLFWSPGKCQLSR